MEERPSDSEMADCTVAELVEQHYDELYRYAYRLSGSRADAEDLTQQTFLTAQAKLDQLRRGDHARAWLFAILRNDYLKSVRPRPANNPLPLDTVPELSSGDVDSEIDEERLQAALNELPEEFRAPLILYYFQEFSYRDISEQMQVPVGTVMSRLARAKIHLRRKLSGPAPPQSKGSSRSIRTKT